MTSPCIAFIVAQGYISHMLASIDACTYGFPGCHLQAVHGYWQGFGHVSVPAVRAELVS